MFKELAPLVRHRAVLFTISYLEDDLFRVNVIPKKVSDAENNALTTPVSITGTAEDLDKELPQTLLHFVSSHLELKNSLERAKAEMDEASKNARAEARKKSSGPTTKRDSAGSPSKSTPAEVPAHVEAPKACSLFDSAPEPAKIVESGAQSSDNSQATSEEPELDEDEEILREAYAEREVEEGDEAA